MSYLMEKDYIVYIFALLICSKRVVGKKDLYKNLFHFFCLTAGTMENLTGRRLKRD